MSTDYCRRPRVGDVINYRTGPARVTRVREYGRRLDLVDGLGRAWDAWRTEEGTWVRLHRAPVDLGRLASMGLAPLPARPAARERVRTWADGFGRWYARVDFPGPGYGPTFLACEADRLRDKARRAIRREIVEREATTSDPRGRNIAPVRVVQVDQRADSIGRIWSVTYAEDVR